MNLAELRNEVFELKAQLQVTKVRVDSLLSWRDETFQKRDAKKEKLKAEKMAKRLIWDEERKRAAESSEKWKQQREIWRKEDEARLQRYKEEDEKELSFGEPTGM